jgi:hypothetical protein
MTRRDGRFSGGWRWVLLAAIVGFLCSFLLSGLLHLPRAAFLTGYAILTGAYFIAYIRQQRLTLQTQLVRRWIAGVIGGVAVGAVLVWQVLAQPPSPHPEGRQLFGQLVLYGLVYGTVDALLLSVVPVIALYGSRASAELHRLGARFKWAGVALLGSALVTAAYHVGFAEFRGPQLSQPVIGNILMTLAYLLTGSPWAAILSHILMHAAAVMHGMATTSQLPPHY